MVIKATFEVLTAAVLVKIEVFWDVTSGRLLKQRGAFLFSHA
jgi:hypothetical protein